MAFAKVYDTMFTGSLRGKGDAIAVFVCILTHTTAKGVCDVSYKVIADELGWDESRIKAAVCVLTSPDPDSRSKDADGRRLVPLRDDGGWGWFVVNHSHYRHLETNDQKREADRVRQQKKRDVDRIVAAGLQKCHVTSRDERDACDTKSGVEAASTYKMSRDMSRVFAFVPSTSDLSTTTDPSALGTNGMEKLKQECISQCSMFGVPDDFGTAVFPYWFREQGTGRRRDWPHYVAGRWMAEREEWAGGNHTLQLRGKNNGTTGTPGAAPAHVQLKVLEEEISSHPANPDNPFKRLNPTELERSSLRTLRSKRDQLRKQIAGV